MNLVIEAPRYQFCEMMRNEYEHLLPASWEHKAHPHGLVHDIPSFPGYLFRRYARKAWQSSSKDSIPQDPASRQSKIQNSQAWTVTSRIANPEGLFSMLTSRLSFPTRASALLPCSLIASLWLLACAVTPAPAKAEEWPGWRGGVHEGCSVSPYGPLHWSAERSVVWKTLLPGEGHSSPIVTGEAVYVSAAWNAETDPRLRSVFRCLLWFALLLVTAPTFVFLLRRCAPEDRDRPRVRALFGLGGTGLLVLALCGLVFYGEALLAFNRAVERGWIAACLCGVFCLTLSSLYAASARRAALAGGLSLLAFAVVLALTIPDRAHTVAADSFSDVSQFIYVVIALPALAGAALLSRWLSHVQRRQNDPAPEPSVSRRFPVPWLLSGTALLLALFTAAILIHLAAGPQRSIERTISVGAPYAPRLPVWTPLLPLMALSLFLLARRKRGGSVWVNSGVVVSVVLTALTGLLTAADRLIARVPYLAYLLGEPDFTPLPGKGGVVLFAVVCVLAPIIGLHLTARGRRPSPRTLPVVARIAASILTPLYFVYANALPRGPRLERGIVCVDRQSGAIRWLCGGVAAPGGVMHSDNSPATPTPVTDGQRVYAYFGAPGLLCADSQGRRLWVNRDLPYSSREGVASSPILCQGRVIVLSESDAGGYLAAVEGETGHLLWRTPRNRKRHSFAGNCRTPTVLTIAGRQVVIVWGYDDVSGYDPVTGRELWTRAVEEVGTGGNPVASAASEGRHLFLFGPYQAMCLDIERIGGSGKFLLWRQETDDGAQCSTPVVRNGLLFAVSDNGSAYCLDARTGKELWRRELEAQHYASVIAMGGRIYFCGTRGRTTVVACDRTFRLLAQNDLKERTFATPAPVDGALFLRTRTHLYGLREP
jgi:outer membrane protein assembly factor BamB